MPDRVTAGGPPKTPASRRRALWLAAIAGALAGALYVAVPLLVSSRLEAALVRALTGTPAVAARVQGSPIAILRGRFAEVHMDARRAVVENLAVDHVTLRLRDMRVDPVALLVRRRLVVVSVGSGAGEAIVRQDDLQRYLASTKGIEQAAVTLADGLMIVEGDVRVLTAVVRAHLEGRLVVATPTTVNLHVQSLTVSGLQIPPEVGNLLTTALNPVVSLRGLPVPTRIEAVSIEPGRVRLSVRTGTGS